jgi:hypothetical protein
MLPTRKERQTSGAGCGWIRVVISLAIILGITALSMASQLQHRSTDRNNPVPLRSNLLSDSLQERDGATYYYSVTAGPGEIVFSLQVSSQGAQTYMEVAVLDGDNRLLLKFDTTSAAKTEKRERLTLGQRQTLLLQLKGARFNAFGNYQLSLKGNLKFDAPPVPQRHNSSESPPISGSSGPPQTVADNSTSSGSSPTLASASLTAPKQYAGQNRGQGVRIKVESGQEIELYAESNALIIGVSNYTAGWPDLPGVKNDVAEISVLLREHGFTITTVSDPTRAQLDQAVRAFITKYGQGIQNRLLIYFAGHGHTIEGVGGQQGYIVPADAPDPGRGESAFKDAAVSMDEIEAYVRRIEAKHLLWVFDSCFSGALFEATRAAPPAITTRTALPVRQFITAGTADQRVPDNSVFRAQFVEGLRGEADRDNDGYVTGEELGLFLNTRVANYTRGSQTPQHGKIRNPRLDKGDFVFALSKQRQLVASVPSALTGEQAYWNVIADSDSPQDFEDYIKKHCPQGIYCDAAQVKLRRLLARNPSSSNNPSSGLLLLIENYKAPPIEGGSGLPETYDYRLKNGSPVPRTLTDVFICDVWQRVRMDLKLNISTQKVSEDIVVRALDVYLSRRWETIAGYRPWTHWNFVRGLSVEQRRILAKEVILYIAKYGVRDVE